MKKSKKDIKRNSKTLQFSIIATFIIIVLISFFYSVPKFTGNVVSNNSSVLDRDYPEPTGYYKESTTYKIEILNYAYSPTELEINVGDQVVWKNRDYSEHTITSIIDYELNSDFLKQGEKFSHTFEHPGEFEYFCRAYPYMRGRIVVNE